MNAERLRALEKTMAVIGVKVKHIPLHERPTDAPKCEHCFSRKVGMVAQVNEYGFWWVEYTAIIECFDCHNVTVYTYLEDGSHE